MLGDFRTKTTLGKASWLLWWQVDEDSLRDQVAWYDTLGWLGSARKQSVVCLSISMVITLVIILTGLVGLYPIADIVLMAILALFIYRGHRWAMIGAMVLWTLERFISPLVGIASRPPSVFSIIISLLWWSAYMHAFYLAFRVEQERRKPDALAGQDLTVWD